MSRLLTTSSLTSLLIQTSQQYYVPVYSPREMILSHGQGARLWDIDGREYLDWGAGIAVNSLGHQDPDLLTALQEQGKKLWHTSNIYLSEPSIRLAEELVKATFADRVFFSNSGAEANEAAIKLARKYASIHFPSEKREILTFHGSFHGRTLTTVTATAQPKYHEGFEPLPGGFRYLPFNDADAAMAAISSHTCAVLIEPLQGEGGVNVANMEFLKLLRNLCDQHHALLIFDEIQCGMGRTGKLFAYQNYNIIPDMMTLAKALGCGFPIGAMVATEKVAQAFSVGSHGSTFGGNPLATAIARVALQKINTPDLLKNVVRQGQKLQQFLSRLQGQFHIFQEIRGKGLLLGAELAGDWRDKSRELTEICRMEGILVLQAGSNVLRFAPPLNMTDEEFQEGCLRFESAIQKAVS